MEGNPKIEKENAKRRPNFTEKESSALVSGVSRQYEALFGKFSNTLTNERKTKLWSEVLDNVNAVSSAVPPRTLAEIKKKYQTLKVNVKKMESINRQEMTKTGGGSAALKEMSGIGRKVLALIPNVEIAGIDGGLDISQMSTIDPTQLNLISMPPSAEVAVASDTASSGLCLMDSPDEFGHPPTAHSSRRTAQVPRKRTRPPETTLYALQAKQVKLLEIQTLQLTRIGNLLAERNAIEQKKLQQNNNS